MNQFKWAAALLLAFLTAANAQVTGSLSGVVTDPADAAVVNASVRIFSAGGSDALITVQTTSSGRFLFPALNPDTYDISIQSSGFAPVTYRQIVVSPRLETSLPTIKLQLQSVAQTVEVIAEAQSLPTQDIQLSTTLTVNRAWDATLAPVSYEIRRYDGLIVRAVPVTVEDDDTAGVSVVTTTPRVTEGATSPHPGATFTYQLFLTRRPDADVAGVVRTNGQLLVRHHGVGSYTSSLVVEFTPEDWNHPVTIEVKAHDDSVVEGPQIELIEHIVTSAGDVATTPTRTDTTDLDGSSTMLLAEPVHLGGTVTATQSSGHWFVEVGATVVGGGYYLTVGGERTRRIAFDADAATVALRLAELSTVGVGHAAEHAVGDALQPGPQAVEQGGVGVHGSSDGSARWFVTRRAVLMLS